MVRNGRQIFFKAQNGVLLISNCLLKKPKDSSLTARDDKEKPQFLTFIKLI